MRFVISEEVEYLLDADSEEEARELAEGWPERHPSYRLVRLLREVVPQVTKHEAT